MVHGFALSPRVSCRRRRSTTASALPIITSTCLVRPFPMVSRSPLIFLCSTAGQAAEHQRDALSKHGWPVRSGLCSFSLRRLFALRPTPLLASLASRTARFSTIAQPCLRQWRSLCRTTTRCENVFSITAFCRRSHVHSLRTRRALHNETRPRNHCLATFRFEYVSFGCCLRLNHSSPCVRSATSRATTCPCRLQARETRLTPPQVPRMTTSLLRCDNGIWLLFLMLVKVSCHRFAGGIGHFNTSERKVEGHADGNSSAVVQSWLYHVSHTRFLLSVVSPALRFPSHKPGRARSFCG